MKTPGQIRYDLEQQIMASPLGDRFNTGQIASIAAWILSDYKPPIEWEDTPPDPDAAEVRDRYMWKVELRTFIAGESIEYVGSITNEAMTRAPSVMEGFRRSVRARVGSAIVKFLDDDQ